MLDNQGNWIPTPIEPPPDTGGAVLGSIGSGSGVPDASTPITTLYQDSDTGDIYSYSNGSWVLVGSSTGGSTQQVYTAEYDDPNAASLVPADPTKGAFFQQDPSITLYNVWIWSVVDQNWKQTVST